MAITKKRKEYYECHITMEGDAKKIEPIVEKTGWKFSKIDGDPILGAGVKCYATAHFNTRYCREFVQQQVDLVAQIFREQKGIKLLRRKVELVLYDIKEAA